MKYKSIKKTKTKNQTFLGKIFSCDGTMKSYFICRWSSLLTFTTSQQTCMKNISSTATGETSRLQGVDWVSEISHWQLRVLCTLTQACPIFEWPAAVQKVPLQLNQAGAPMPHRVSHFPPSCLAIGSLSPMVCTAPSHPQGAGAGSRSQKREGEPRDFRGGNRWRRVGSVLRSQAWGSDAAHGLFCWTILQKNNFNN